jgi:hypothetical protein
MTPCRALLAALSAVALVAGVVAIQRALDAGPVYSVDQVRVGLVNNPRAWLGRTIRVRGIVPSYYCPGPISLSCPPAPSTTLHSVARASDRSLPLFFGSAEGEASLFQSEPILRSLLPGPQHLLRGRAAVYRVRLQALAGDVCGYWPCYVTVLIDAAPDPLLRPLPPIQPVTDPPSAAMATAAR